MTQKSVSIRDWIGRREVVEAVISSQPAADMDDLLGGSGIGPEAGWPLPLGWHWMYGVKRVPMGGLGPDGHPRRGDFMPPVTLTRRLFAGATLQCHQPLCIGQTATFQREITSIKCKEGRQGTLVFVDVETQVRVLDQVAVSDTVTLVYRDVPPRDAPSATAARTQSEADRRPEPGWQEWVETDPVSLFRFSALTWNSHRVHYDYRYATEVEGYPERLVHGPFLALRLLAACQRAVPGRKAQAMSFRILAPVFVGMRYLAAGRLRDEGGGADLWAMREDGTVALTAEVTLG